MTASGIDDVTRVAHALEVFLSVRLLGGLWPGKKGRK